MVCYPISRKIRSIMNIQLDGIVAEIKPGFIKLAFVSDYYHDGRSDFTKKWLMQYLKRENLKYFTIGTVKCKFLNKDGIDVEKEQLMNSHVKLSHLWFYSYGEPKRKAIGVREIKMSD